MLRKLLNWKSASKRIAAAIAGFESLAEMLDAAAAECRAGIDSRYAKIETLYDEADALHNDASRGESLAGRLRRLMA